MSRLVGGFFSLLVLVAIGVAAAFIWFDHQASEPGPLTEQTTVVIPRGAGVEDIAHALDQAGVIDDTFVMMLRVRWLGAGRQLKAGEYVFVPAMSIDDVIGYLSQGKTVVRKLSVPEGLTTAQIVALIRDADGLAGTIETVPQEGSLLPETYHFELGDTRDEMVQRMSAAMQGTLDELWERRDPDIYLTSLAEAVVLASIVEKETGVPEERAHIAGVFYNRLVRGMMLQSDPTVIYAVTGGESDLGRALTRSDLDIDNPYNTYRHTGLPPGPIANPGRDALEAVLNPMETDDIYFVADGTGGHAFARTLSEHNNNVAAYRAWLRSQDD